MKSKPEICKWIQSSAIIKRSNIVRYCINNCKNSGRIHVSKRCWIHKRYPYLTPSGELWDVFCEYFWENWPRYNSTTLYFHIPLPLTLESHGPLNRQLNWNSLPERSWNPPGLEHPSQNCGQLWDYPQWQKKPALWTTGVVYARDWINSLTTGKFWWNFRYLIFQKISVIDGWGISCELALRWMSLDLTDDKSTLVQVMAWCHQATSHYLNQCWPRSLLPYGVTRPQWVKDKPGAIIVNSLITVESDLETHHQSSTKPNLVAKISATKFGSFLVVYIML